MEVCGSGPQLMPLEKDLDELAKEIWEAAVGDKALYWCSLLVLATFLATVLGCLHDLTVGKSDCL